ncbi:MAG: aspartate carbamoyltransferase catalytic subunit [Myxococcales bacterium]
MWTHRHLLGIESLLPSEIQFLLDRAESFASSIEKTARLRGKVVVNLFFEASTRTRTSFELAAKRLGADIINVSPSTSSVIKGETLLDTAKNVEAMRIDAIVLRHSASGSPHFLAKRTSTVIVNAGDGAHEHPTQALLDALTMRRHKGRIDGLVVAICGDILHSRVARSNAILLRTMGAEVRLAGPRTMMPPSAETIAPGVPGVTIHHRLEDAVEGADVVMMLRIQTERFGVSCLSTLREYSRTFGLTERMLTRAKSDVLVMHPGPINRGVELDAKLADGASSVILEQVEMGVAVRMAVLDTLLRRA